MEVSDWRRVVGPGSVGTESLSGTDRGTVERAGDDR